MGRRADAHAGRGRAQGGRAPHIRQQTGFAQRDERRRDHRQAGTALAAKQELVHPGDVRDLWGRAVRGSGLAKQSAQERDSLTPSSASSASFGKRNIEDFQDIGVERTLPRRESKSAI